MNYKLIPFFLLIFICTLPVQAKMFKWVDEEGNTHFGDKIPNKYLHKGHKELNDQGAVVGTHVEVKAETEESKQERIRLEQIAKEKEKEAKAQARQDRVLVDTYTTERDLTAAQEARLDAVDSQLQLSTSIIADTKRKIAVTEDQINNIKAAGNKVPKNILDKKKGEEKQLQTYQDLATKHEKRKLEINEQFDGYIKRFRELMEDKKSRKAARDAKKK